LKKLFLFLTLILLLTLHSVGGNKSPKILSFEEKFCKVVELLDSKPELEKKTTKRAEKLVKQGKDFLQKRQIKKAKTCFEQAIKESEKAYGKYSGFTIFLCLEIADIYSGCEKYNLAAEYMDKIFELNHELCYKLSAKSFLNIMSNAFAIYALCSSNEKFNRCISFANKYINSLSKEEKTKYLSNFYFKLAIQLRYLNRENEAINILQKAIIWTDKNNYDLHRKLLINKAFCYSALNQFKKAQTLLKEAFKYLSKYSSCKKGSLFAELFSKQILLYIKEAGYLRKKKKFKKAQITLSKAKNILNAIKDTDFYRQNLADIYLAYGWICYDQRKYSDAIKFYKKTIEVFGRNFDSEYNRAADTYLHLAGAYQNNKQAEKYYQRALTIANKTEDEKLLQATVLYFTGIYYCNNSHYKLGIKNLQMAADKLEEKPLKFSKKIEKIKAKIKSYMKKLNPKS
jgi:tetratricopeptide (TPR) repeat protein